MLVTSNLPLNNHVLYMLHNIIFSKTFYIFLCVLWLVTVTVTVTNIWPSDVATNSNSKF